MRLLLDTHTLLWWLAEDLKLSGRAYSAINDPHSEVYVSASSIWELAIKKASGKLDFPPDLEERMKAEDLIPLPITAIHALAVLNLPMHHKDPFDRMLVAQCMIERLTLVSRDTEIHAYDVPIVW